MICFWKFLVEFTSSTKVDLVWGYAEQDGMVIRKNSRETNFGHNLGQKVGYIWSSGRMFCNWDKPFWNISNFFLPQKVVRGSSLTFLAQWELHSYLEIRRLKTWTKNILHIPQSWGGTIQSWYWHIQSWHPHNNHDQSKHNCYRNVEKNSEASQMQAKNTCGFFLKLCTNFVSLEGQLSIFCTKIILNYLVNLFCTACHLVMSLPATIL